MDDSIHVLLIPEHRVNYLYSDITYLLQVQSYGTSRVLHEALPRQKQPPKTIEVKAASETTESPRPNMFYHVRITLSA